MLQKEKKLGVRHGLISRPVREEEESKGKGKRYELV